MSGRESSRDRTAARSGRRGLPWGRLGLLAALLVVLGLAALEFSARRASHAAYSQIASVLDSEESIEPADVQRMIGRKPIDAYEATERRWVEVYRWEGVVQPYTLYVYYRIGATRLLLAVSHNSHRWTRPVGKRRDALAAPSGRSVRPPMWVIGATWCGAPRATRRAVSRGRFRG